MTKLKPITDEQVKKFVDNGINEIYRLIQNHIGQDTGDNAGIYHTTPQGEELVEEIEKFFMGYADFEIEQDWDK